MGEVVQLQPHMSERAPVGRVSRADALVPVEFAIGIDDREAAIARLAYYGVNSFAHRSLKGSSAEPLCMVSVQDAINVNKKILEHEDLEVDVIGERIDLIQMLENINVPMMQSLWGSITCQSQSTAEA